MPRRKRVAACWRQFPQMVAPRSVSPIRWAKCESRFGRRFRSAELKSARLEPKNPANRRAQTEVVAKFAAVFVCERRLTDFSAAPRVVHSYIKLFNFQEKGRCV